ncbi:hypothetical protein KC345_g89 [Hortaea werneckii]|nr:hypothetical protein KC345_g89 [Hortaea werneckii]
MKADLFRTHDQHYCSASKSSVSIAYPIVTAQRALEPTRRIESALLTICFTQPWRRLSLSSSPSLIKSTSGLLILTKNDAAEQVHDRLDISERCEGPGPVYCTTLYRMGAAAALLHKN